MKEKRRREKENMKRERKILKLTISVSIICLVLQSNQLPLYNGMNVLFAKNQFKINFENNTD